MTYWNNKTGHPLKTPPRSFPEEFDVEGATYYAVAEAGYVYSEKQTAIYSTRKYNTLFAAEAGLAASPTTPQVINIIGPWTGADNTPVTFSGTSTTSTNYILVQAIGDNIADAKWSTDKYRLEGVSTLYTIEINDDYVRFYGIQASNDVAGHFNGTIHSQNMTRDDTYFEFDRCFFINTSVPNTGYTFRLESYPQYTLKNCVIVCRSTYDNDSSAAAELTSDATYGESYIYNNTFHSDGLYAIRTRSTVLYLKNNIFSGGTTAAINESVSPHADSDYNASTESDTTGGGNDIANASISFVDAPNNDFHLRSSDLIVRSAGTDLSNSFTTDIDGDYRAFWDIGADEYRKSP